MSLVLLKGLEKEAITWAGLQGAPFESSVHPPAGRSAWACWPPGPLVVNERPAWLDTAHSELDEAVYAAYGWPPDLSDAETLARLLALNLERARR